MRTIIKNILNGIVLLLCAVFAAYINAQCGVLLPASWHAWYMMLAWLILPLIVMLIWLSFLAIILFDNN